MHGGTCQGLDIFKQSILDPFHDAAKYRLNVGFKLCGFIFQSSFKAFHVDIQLITLRIDFVAVQIIAVNERVQVGIETGKFAPYGLGYVAREKLFRMLLKLIERRDQFVELIGHFAEWSRLRNPGTTLDRHSQRLSLNRDLARRTSHEDAQAVLDGTFDRGQLFGWDLLAANRRVGERAIDETPRGDDGKKPPDERDQLRSGDGSHG